MFLRASGKVGKQIKLATFFNVRRNTKFLVLRYSYYFAKPGSEKIIMSDACCIVCPKRIDKPRLISVADYQKVANNQIGT